MSTLTKIFIILQLVFSLALSVMVIMVVSSQPKYKDQVEAQAKLTIAAQAALARAENLSDQKTTAVAQLTEALAKEVNAGKTRLMETTSRVAALEKDKADALNRINLAEATNSQYASTISSLKDQYTAISKELNDVRDRNLTLLRRAEETARVNESLTQDKDSLTKALRKTQEELVAITSKYEDLLNKPAAAGGPGAGVAGGGSITEIVGFSKPVAINGTVGRVTVTDGKTYFSLPLGKRDGLQNGLTLVISRNNSYVGDAEVINTTVNEAVAQVKILSKGQTVQSGDVAAVQR